MNNYPLKPNKIILSGFEGIISTNNNGDTIIEAVGSGYFDMDLEGLSPDEVAELIVRESWEEEVVDHEKMVDSVKTNILENHLSADDAEYFDKHIEDMDMDTLVEMANIDAEDAAAYLDHEELAKYISKDVLANTLMGNNSD
ncbi:MAG: hypothetical protein GY746_16230 [Gammaproteobacteria bacterium]|nr:hypothetical protein [Gammaproteobacteria bacterium]